MLKKDYATAISKFEQIGLETDLGENPVSLMETPCPSRGMDDTSSVVGEATRSALLILKNAHHLKSLINA